MGKYTTKLKRRDIFFKNLKLDFEGTWGQKKIKEFDQKLVAENKTEFSKSKP